MLTDAHRLRTESLRLYGLLAHWAEIEDSTWVERLLNWEEAERAQRSLERRLGSAHIGRFKPMADFDWDWPEQCDRLAITELMGLEFLKTAANAILVGASGLGKSMIAQNITHQAVLGGHTALYHRRATPRRVGVLGQRFGLASAFAALRRARPIGDR